MTTAVPGAPPRGEKTLIMGAVVTCERGGTDIAAERIGDAERSAARRRGTVARIWVGEVTENELAFSSV